MSTQNVTDNIETRLQDGILLQKIAVTAASNGSVSYTIDSGGLLTRILIVPATSGDQPSDLFDLTIKDEGGGILYKNIDIPNVFNGVPGITGSTHFFPSNWGKDALVACGPITYQFQNMGNKKKCTIYVYYVKYSKL